MKDDNLGERFINGGEEVLEDVIKTYGDKLLRYSTAIVCDYQEAEDIVQDSFISAYNNKKKFDGSNLSAWLYKIVYNYSLNYLKRRKLLYFSDIHTKEIAKRDNEDEEFSDEVLRALKKIKPKDRALLYGRIIEEQSYEELSELIGISEVTLRKRYQRAKDKLAKEVTHEYDRKGFKYE